MLHDASIKSDTVEDFHNYYTVRVRVFSRELFGKTHWTSSTGLCTKFHPTQSPQRTSIGTFASSHDLILDDQRPYQTENDLQVSIANVLEKQQASINRTTTQSHVNTKTRSIRSINEAACSTIIVRWKHTTCRNFGRRLMQLSRVCVFEISSRYSQDKSCWAIWVLWEHRQQKAKKVYSL